MMRYFKWEEKDVQGLNSDGISCVYTEVNEDGRVVREIGIDMSGKISHKWPSSNSKFGKYGLFDLAQYNGRYCQAHPGKRSGAGSGRLLLSLWQGCGDSGA